MRRNATVIALNAACLSLLALAPSALAAGPPTAITGTNSFDGQGGTIVRGYVNPNGSAVTDCHFEYGSTEAYGQTAPCAGRNEEQKLTVSATAGQFRLSFGGDATADLPFNAGYGLVQEQLEALPSIGPGNVMVTGSYTIAFIGALAEQDTEQIAAENGTVPLSGGGASATVSTTIQGAASGADYLGSAEIPTEVSVDLSGLAPGTIYHYAVSATTGEGTKTSEDGLFASPATPEAAQSCANEALRTEQHSTFLPECRAYEMVSPPDKHGPDVNQMTSRTRVAPDGSAAVFGTATGFGDTAGYPYSDWYMSLRSTSPDPGGTGWSTHGLLPAQPSNGYKGVASAFETRYPGEFSPDLDRAVLQAYRPLFGETDVAANPANLYLRDDLRSSGTGSYTLLTQCPLCATSGPLPKFEFPEKITLLAGASTDLQHVIFESLYNLVAGASGSGRKLYESENGTVRLVGISPSNVPMIKSFAGTGQLETAEEVPPHVISADGSKIFFTNTDDNTGDVYMRLNHTQTVRLNASERSPADSHESAVYQEASVDGSRVLFLSQEALTSDSPVSGLKKLYVYDTTKPASDPHNLTYIAPSSSVLAASPDGTHVYFYPDGSEQLVPGGPPLPSSGLFAWHDGQISYVKSMELFEIAKESIGLPSYRRAQVATDGTLLFSRLDTDEIRQLYTYEPDTTQLQCVSCNPGTLPARSADVLVQAGGSFIPLGISDPSALTPNGRYVFFYTGEPLSAADTNGVIDTYLYDTGTGGVRLLSSGTDSHDSYPLAASPDGHDVMIATRQRLLGWDVDGSYDLYDVRIGGGFPEPPPTPAPCPGESCLPAAQGGPPVTAPSSAALAGPGNPRRRCPKGTRAIRRKGHLRCVKRHRGHRHHSRHRSNGRPIR